MVFYLIGIGLADEEVRGRLRRWKHITVTWLTPCDARARRASQDITLKGLRAVQRCSAVYIEAYTSILSVPREKLEKLFEKPIEEAPRELVESGIEPLLERGRTEDIALLVVGDAFGATTHCDLLARAKAMGVPTQVVHNASIMTAVGCCGLQLYRYGETVSVPFFTRGWRPDSFYDKMAANRSAGLHTLALLDIKVREPTMASLARGRPTYLPPRFMSIRVAINQLLEIESSRGQGVCPPETQAVGLARVGCADQLVVSGTLEALRAVDFGGPLHSLVLLGKEGADEAELLAAFCTDAACAPVLSPAAARLEDEAVARADAAHAGEKWNDAGGGDDDDDAPVDAEAQPTSTSGGGSSSGGGSGAPPADSAAGGKRGGLHKFDAAEVDVEGGKATADEFLEAFGMDD